MPTSSETEILPVSPAESAMPPSVYDGVEAWEINDQRTSAYCRKTVRKETWKRVIQEYPALKGKPDLLRLFYWCVFGAKDEETGAPLIGAHHCANAERKQLTRNYRPLKLLERFQQAVGGSEVFDWSEYSYRERKCRIVKYFRIPPSLLRVLTEELHANPHASTRVYLESGRVFRRAKPKAATAKQTEELDDIRLKLKPLNARQAEVLEYMNQRADRHFEQIYKRNFDDTWSEATREPVKTKRDSYKELLTRIHEQYGAPSYASTVEGNTARIFTVGASLTNLPRHLRKIYCRGWVELDLRNAQLAIASKVWKIPELHEFLSKGISFWEELYTWFGRRNDDLYYGSVKPIFKEAVYATLFGAQKKTIEGILAALPVESPLKHFLGHPLVKLLWEARKRRLRQIKKDGCRIVDLFGDVYRRPKKEAYKLLATECQNVEFYLMSQALDVVKGKEDQVCITLWQHDGCSIWVRDSSRRDGWIARIKKKVDLCANDLGIPTELEAQIL